MEAVAVELDEGEPLPDWREFDARAGDGRPDGRRRRRRAPLAGGGEGAGARGGRGRAAVPRRLPRRAAPRRGARRAASTRSSGAEVGLLAGRADRRGREHPLFAGIDEPLVSLQWHGDTFELPPGAVPLARSPAAPNQAFRAGERAYGVQFHLEVTAEMAREWADGPGLPRLARRRPSGEDGGAAFLAEVERRADELHPAARRLFSNWLDLV